MADPTPAPEKDPAPEPAKDPAPTSEPTAEPTAEAPAKTGEPAAAPSGEPAAEPEPKTIIEGGKPEDPEPVAAPADWPENWRQVMAGGDEKLLARLNRFSSPVNVFKSWLAAQQKIGSGELIKAKPDGSDPQALNEWRAQAGIPEKPEGYLEKLPNGLVIGDADKEMVGSFTEAMHAADTPPAFVHNAISWWYKLQDDIEAKRTEDDHATRQQTEDALRSEYGSEYRSNINGIKALIDRFGGEEVSNKLFSTRLADGTPLGDDPDLIRFLVSLHREINPHGTIVPREGKSVDQSIEAEIKELEVEMADTNPTDATKYWKNPTKQARYTQLMEMRDKARARA